MWLGDIVDDADWCHQLVMACNKLAVSTTYAGWPWVTQHPMPSPCIPCITFNWNVCTTCCRIVRVDLKFPDTPVLSAEAMDFIRKVRACHPEQQCRNAGALSCHMLCLMRSIVAPMDPMSASQHAVPL
jgi:hypothetical protein